MKANRMRFDKIKAMHQINMMTAAYINAERQIMANPGLTGFDKVEDVLAEQGWNVSYKTEYLTPEEFNDRVAKSKSMTIKDVQAIELEARLKELEELGREMIEKEDYLAAEEAKQLWERTKRQLDNLK